MILNKASWDDWIEYRYKERGKLDEVLTSKPNYDDAVGLIKNLDKLKKKSAYYTFVLYLDNLTNMLLKDFLEKSGQYDFAYILHEKPDDSISATALADIGDIDTAFLANTLSKPHYHVMVKYGYSKPWSTVVKDLYKWGVTYCEPVMSPDDMLIYFTHRDPKSLLSGKETYNFEDIIYTGVFIDRVARLMHREDKKNLINPRDDLLEYAYLCESRYDFYKYAFSDAMLDKEFRTHQLTFENILKSRGIR